jgi:hypothetical protein
MAIIDFMPTGGKKNSKNFAETLGKGFAESLGNERHSSRARKALHDMIVFNEAVEEEMQVLLNASSEGKAVDHDMLSKMAAVREKYFAMLEGFKTFDYQREHLALVIYADAVQDLIKQINKQKKH